MVLHVRTGCKEGMSNCSPAVLVPPDLHYLPTGQYMGVPGNANRLPRTGHTSLPPVFTDKKIGTKRDARWLVLMGRRSMNSSGSDVTIVMITHNRLAEVLHSLEHLSRLPERPKILVVDNGSSDGTAAAVGRQFPLALASWCAGSAIKRPAQLIQRPKMRLEPSRVVLYPFAQHSVRHGDPLEHHGGRYDAPPLASRHRLQILGT